MDLSQHLKCTGETPASFAKRIGCSTQAVYRYIKGQRIPRPAMMRKIMDAANGAVTPTDFIQKDGAQ